MSPWLIALMGFAYLGIALDQFFKGNIPLSIMFGGYAFSNVGLYFLAKGG